MEEKCKYLLKYFISIIIIISILLYIITSLHPTFMLDESFTYSLTRHTIKKIINMDMMDVHPPLYYICLKLFLYLTTFWTNSIFIKIIFCRIFSIILYIIFYIFGLKLLKLCNIKINGLIQLIILCLCPIIIKDAILIRMYQLSSTFLIIEFYYLIKFIKCNQTKCLIIVSIFSILTSYTFYFAALSSGIYLLLVFLYFVYKKNYKNCTKIFITMCILIIFYIPWIPYALHQFKYHRYIDNNIGNNILTTSLVSFTQIPNINYIITIFIGIIFCTLFIMSFYSIRISIKENNYLFLISFINLLTTFIISISLCGKQYQSNAIVPIFTIWMFLLVAVMNNRIITNISINKFIKGYLIVLLCFLSIFMCGKDYKNIISYDIPSITLMKNMNNWEHSYNKYIQLRNSSYPLNKGMTISEDSLYLNSIHKRIVVNNYSYHSFANTILNDSRNLKLIKKLFPNVYIKNNNLYN